VNGPSGYSACWHTAYPWKDRDGTPHRLRDHVSHSLQEPHANFGGDRLSGKGTGQIPACRSTTNFCPFFTSSLFDSIWKATAETAEPILTRNGSNNASS